MKHLISMFISFKNLGNKTLKEIDSKIHGITGGDRDITYGDLNHDGLLDIVVIDGNAGGYKGMDNIPDISQIILKQMITG
ncbi:MAG TPA: VCBS repeat-containing protein [Thermoplasmatales archaeon]|nr:VCBS repeat-containing protein [Thermoplasmatales archaeon]